MNIRLINDVFYKPDFMEFLMRLPCFRERKRSLQKANGKKGSDGRKRQGEKL